MRRACLASVLVLSLSGAASAQALHTKDQGWYRVDGFHDPSNQNYIAGDCSFGCGFSEYRDFFVFDLTGVTGTVIGATLAMQMPPSGYQSPDPSETLTLFDYNGSIASLVAGTGGAAAFQDLGSGTTFGTKTIFPTPPTGKREEIPLNPSAIAAINAARGGMFALGGTVTTLDAVANNEFVFGGSTGIPARLVLRYGGGGSAITPAAPRSWKGSIGFGTALQSGR